MTAYNIKDNISKIMLRIANAAERTGRNENNITLVAVSKKKPVDMVREAFELGVADIGENYVQELTQKEACLSMLPIRWHFVGRLQRRKAKDIVGKVCLVHSLDSLKLALEMEKSAEKINVVQHCLVQVNLSGEAAKSGFPPDDVKSFISEISPLLHLEITGLMTLPPFFGNPEMVRPYFKKLRELKDSINAEKTYRSNLSELSMGMTHDFEAAIEEGATLVRIGTGIFGERK